MSMITATAWVPRGFAAQFPTKYDFDEEEFDRIAKLAKLQLDDAQDDLDEARKDANGGNSAGNGVAASKTNEEVDDDLREYDLEHYDDDSDEDGDQNMAEGGIPGGKDAMGMFGNVKNLVYHHSNQDDPYITLNDDAQSDDEREELQILPTDNLILAARVEDEVAHLEVYVYEDEADNLYVHHDVMLPAIPLAVEWIHAPVVKQDSDAETTSGNFVAVGTMDPDIELWDLDTVDCMYPHAILGAGASNLSSDPSKSHKKKKKSKKPRKEYHTDAILSLASNPTHRNLLASASADTTIKLWDLNTAATNGSQCAKSHTYHTDKVCSLAWHPSEPTALLSGSYDRRVIAADMRALDASSASRQWQVESDVENVKWDPHDSNLFYVSTESGMLHQLDARATPASSSSATASAVSKTLWTLQAHDAPLSAFDVNPHIPGFIATGSADKTVKLWRTSAASATESTAGPALVATRNPDAGRIFGASFAPDVEVAYRLAVAGSKGALQIWDTSTNAGVRRAFAGTAGPAAVSGDADAAVERVVGLSLDDDDDDSESSDGGEDEGGGVDVE